MFIFTNNLIQRWLTYHKDIGTFYSFFVALGEITQTFFWMESFRIYWFIFISIILFPYILEIGLISRFTTVQTPNLNIHD